MDHVCVYFVYCNFLHARVREFVRMLVLLRFACLCNMCVYVCMYVCMYVCICCACALSACVRTGVFVRV
jgi:hypothetical protein